MIQGNIYTKLNEQLTFQAVWWKLIRDSILQCLNNGLKNDLNTYQ